MGLLDGDLQRIFGNVFAPFFLDGTLHSAQVTDDGEGGASVTFLSFPIKAMRDQWRKEYSQYGIPDTSAVILVLQKGVLTFPKADDQMTIAELQSGVATTSRWVVGPIGQDPASAHWIIGAKPAEAS